MRLRNRPVTGGTAPTTAVRTAQKLSAFALRYAAPHGSRCQGGRYLDVGCGNGFITEHVAAAFDEVVGIDVEPERLAECRRRLGGTGKFTILSMSAERIEFPEAYFSFVTSFEVLEHVPSLVPAVDEIVRVLAPGGVLVVSVPHVGFPFENHGMRVGRRVIAKKIPLLPYVRPLHRRHALARVFSSGEIDGLFGERGLRRLETAYASPQCERAAARRGSWESRFARLRLVLDRCEEVPFLRALTGVSMLKAYRKPTGTRRGPAGVRRPAGAA